MTDPTGVISQLLAITKSIAPLATFVTGGQLQKAIEAVGSRHLDAALLALSDAKQANHPRDRLNSAVNSLTEAYTHLSPLRQSSIVRYFRSRTPFLATSQMENHLRAAACAALIASCYTYLKESQSNRRTWMERCYEEMLGWSDIYLEEYADRLKNGIKVGAAPKEYQDRAERTLKEVKTLEKQLLAM